MSDEISPTLGQWYHNMETEQDFWIVAIDDEVIEIQYLDGDVEELEMDVWEEMELEEIEQPEDWAAQFDDLDLDDTSGTGSPIRHEDWSESLDELD